VGVHCRLASEVCETNKALAIGEGVTVIDHDTIETGQGCHFGKTLGNVSSADDVHSMTSPSAGNYLRKLKALLRKR